MIHVRFDGRSVDLDARALDLTGPRTDAEIKRRLAHHFDVQFDRFAGYVVDRRPNGTVVVRPEAVYG